MISSFPTNSLFRFASKFVKAKALDLTKMVNEGEVFNSQGFVTLGMTTNRTKKVGDDIFSTPAMIHRMNQFVIGKLNEKLPPEHFSVSTKVCCQHKAPLSIGERFHLLAKVNNVKENDVEFSVLCQSDQNVVIGDATINLKVVVSNN